MKSAARLPPVEQARSPAPRAAILGALVLAGALSSSGCATVVAVVSHPAVTGAGVVSLLASGKGLADHAMDMVTRRDCRLLDGLLREERRVCEERGSLATLADFRGYAPLRNLLAGAGPAPDTPRLALDTDLDADRMRAAPAPAGGRPNRQPGAAGGNALQLVMTPRPIFGRGPAALPSRTGLTGEAGPARAL